MVTYICRFEYLSCQVDTKSFKAKEDLLVDLRFLVVHFCCFVLEIGGHGSIHAVPIVEGKQADCVEANVG